MTDNFSMSMKLFTCSYGAREFNSAVESYVFHMFASHSFRLQLNRFLITFRVVKPPVGLFA